MTTTQQHIALMESLGWTECRVDERVRTQCAGIPPGDKAVWVLPNLTLDLMAQAEATLTATQEAAYYGELHRALHKGYMSLRHQQWMPVIRATKEQRLEAYLRTRGLWVQS